MDNRDKAEQLAQQEARMEQAWLEELAAAREARAQVAELEQVAGALAATLVLVVLAAGLVVAQLTS